MRDRRLPAQPREHAEHLVADGRRGGGGILRVKRHDQYAIAAAFTKSMSRNAIEGLP